MIISYKAQQPDIDPTAYIAPTAVIRGDVTIGAGSVILFGAIITAEGGSVKIGSNCVIMENTVVRGTPRHPLRIGDCVLVGPHSHISGATINDNVFIATGASIFNGALIGANSEVRINGVVHTNTELGDESIVPIGWIAVGGKIFPPKDHDQIWEIQKQLDFPKTVFKAERPVDQGQVIANYAKSLLRQQDDQITSTAND